VEATSPQVQSTLLSA